MVSTTFKYVLFQRKGHSQMFFKTGILQIFAKFTGKHLC